MGGRILIYGANGFSGRLLAERAAALGLDTVLGGRDRDALDALGRQTGLPMRVVALDDPRRLDAALRDMAVIVNAAGPFSATALPVVRSCLRTGTHYLDLSGEIPSFQAVQACDLAAREAGIMLMPGVGFAVVATDCLAAHVAGRMPQARTLRLALSRTDLVSRGSAATTLDLIREGISVRRDGRLAAVPAGRLERGFDFGAGERGCTAVGWADVFTAHYTTRIPDIETYVEAGPWLRSICHLTAWSSAPLRMPAIRQAMALCLQAWPEGPTEAQRAAEIRVIVAEAEDPYRRRIQARLFTPNAYSFTRLSAMAIAARVAEGEVRPGFQTPARVFGADFVLGLDGVRREDVAVFSRPLTAPIGDQRASST